MPERFIPLARTVALGINFCFEELFRANVGEDLFEDAYSGEDCSSGESHGWTAAASSCSGLGFCLRTSKSICFVASEAGVDFSSGST